MLQCITLNFMPQFVKRRWQISLFDFLSVALNSKATHTSICMINTLISLVCPSAHMSDCEVHNSPSELGG